MEFNDRSPEPTRGMDKVVVTTTGAYSVDFDAAYAARKFDQSHRRENRFDNNSNSNYREPRQLSRDELIQNCESQFIKERSKSGGRQAPELGPLPRQRVPVPQANDVSTEQNRYRGNTDTMQSMSTFRDPLMN